jgi:hypothetical protein
VKPGTVILHSRADDVVPFGDSEELLGTSVRYEVEVLIRGRQAKTTAEDRARRQNRETRQAKGEVRAATLTLRPPDRPNRKLLPVTVNVALVREPNPPPGEPPVEWMLLTTLPIDTPEQVRTIVACYCVREALHSDQPRAVKNDVRVLVGQHRRRPFSRDFVREIHGSRQMRSGRNTLGATPPPR